MMTAPRDLQVAEGDKFGLLAIHTGWISPSLAAQFNIGPFAFSRSAPIALSDFWRDALGSFRLRDLSDSNLFVLITAVADAPPILNGENRTLLDHIWRLYFGLLIALPYASHDHGMKLTGANAGSGPEVREVQQIDPVYFVMGAPRPELDETHVRTATTIADSISRLSQVGEHNRIWRVTHAFYDALRSPDAGVRIHQFVRCIEGFILPDIGRTERQFISRTELFIGPRFHPIMRQLFAIRSAVEHLHGPLRPLEGSSERERRLLLLKRSVEVEAIARHCLCRLLTRQRAQQAYASDQDLAAFWALSEDERRRQWGPPLDFDAVTHSFQESMVDDEDLGLA